MIVTNDEALAERARKFAGIGYRNLTAGASRMAMLPSEFQDPDYERFDSIGLNYRMTEISAAIGLAQLERVQILVQRRQTVARMFDEAVSGCKWMIPQFTPPGYIHSYYTYAVQYYGNETHGVSWKEFYQRYKDLGGDGFYGACKVPYLEPVFRNLVINGRRYGAGLCPTAERIQPRIMQFKTNYRDLEVAQRKTSVLAKLITELGR
jgi:perosamine synthetase